MDQTATSTRFLGGSKKFYLNVAIMLCIEIFFRFIPPFGEMTAMGMAVLGVFLGTVYGWLTLDSMPVASLLGVLMMVTTGFYSTANEAFSASFGGTLCLQLIMIFGLVGVLNDANCTELYVRKILNSKLGKRSIWMMLFLFFLCQYILGFFGSWALTLLLLALWREVCKVTGAERGLLTFGISTIILATLFSGQALSFSPVVLVLDGMFSNYTGLPAAPFVNYTVWMFLVSILSGILWLLVGKFLMKIPSPDLKHVSLSQKQKLTRYQLYASIAALIFILGLIYASIFQDPVAVFLNKFGLLGFAAIFLWVFIAIRPADGIQQFGALMGKSVMWDVIVNLAMVTVLSSCMGDPATGIAATVQNVLAFMTDLPLPVFLILITLLPLVLTQYLNNMAVSAVFIPVAASFAISIGVNVYALNAAEYVLTSVAMASPAGCSLAAIYFSLDDMDSKTCTKHAWIAIACTWVVTLLWGVLLTGNLFFPQG